MNDDVGVHDVLQGEMKQKWRVLLHALRVKKK